MKTTNNTVLITGGASGIGFAIARLLIEKENRVIIAGRNRQKLDNAAAQLKNSKAFVCDINNEAEVDRMAATIRKDFSGLNVLINNAGMANRYNISEAADAYSKGKEEMSTNFLAHVRLTERLLPILARQPEAAIINISSVTAFVPALTLPTYSASKAALHSYTQTLRFTLEENSDIKVFEALPPLVDTELAKDLTGDKISPVIVAEDIINAMKNDNYEIHTGATAMLHKLYQSSPIDAILALNSSGNR